MWPWNMRPYNRWSWNMWPYNMWPFHMNRKLKIKLIRSEIDKFNIKLCNPCVNRCWSKSRGTLVGSFMLSVLHYLWYNCGTYLFSQEQIDSWLDLQDIPDSQTPTTASQSLQEPFFTPLLMPGTHYQLSLPRSNYMKSGLSDGLEVILSWADRVTKNH